MSYLKGPKALERNRLCLQRFNSGQRRGLGLQIYDEGLKCRFRSLDLNIDAAGVVEHPSGKPVIFREVVDEGAEPHALHNTGDADAACDTFLCVLHPTPSIY